MLGIFDTDYAYDVKLSSDGQYAFVADDDDGLQIINVSDVTDPTHVKTFDTSGDAYDVAALSSDDQYAFVADGNGGLDIINVSDVTNPTLAGNYNTSVHARGVLSSDDQYAFVVDSVGCTSDHQRIRRNGSDTC